MVRPAAEEVVRLEPAAELNEPVNWFVLARLNDTVGLGVLTTGLIAAADLTGGGVMVWAADDVPVDRQPENPEEAVELAVEEAALPNEGERFPPPDTEENVRLEPAAELNAPLRRCGYASPARVAAKIPILMSLMVLSLLPGAELSNGVTERRESRRLWL